MLITSSLKLASDMERLLRQLYHAKRISKNDYSALLKELRRNAFEITCAPVKLFYINTFKGYDEAICFAKEMGIELPDYTGYRIYDRNIWLYTAMVASPNNNGEREINVLTRLTEWFEEVIQPKENCQLVKYNDEIEQCLRDGKSFYNVGSQIKGRKPIYHIDELDEFEKIVTLENRVKGTKLFYGIW